MIKELLYRKISYLFTSVSQINYRSARRWQITVFYFFNYLFHKMSVQTPSVSFLLNNREAGGTTDKSEDERLQRAKLQAEAAEKWEQFN